MTIVEFLRARLDEDEVAAKAAIDPSRPGTHWEWEAPDEGGDPESPRWLRTVEEFPTTSGVGDLPGFPLGYDCKATPSAAMDHIARHDPARVLREIAAKRALIADYQRYEAERRRMMNGWAPSTESPVIKAFAAVYSDHPDFDPAWG